MNAHRIPQAVSITLALALALAACSPAVTPASAPPATQRHGATQVVVQTQVVEAEAYYGTPAPQTTLAPIVVAGSTATPAPFNLPPTPAPTTPADMFFEQYGVNPFVDTAEDHLSTFALDVDTASYAIARRYVNDGLLPPPEAVRVEEFVNYFDQGYTPPPDVAFAIYADGAPSPFHPDGSYLLRVGIQGYEVPDSQRKPASLTFVIDVSGSMAMESRLELVKRTLELLVERLRPDDRVSIVVYGSDARVILYPTGGGDKGTLLNAIYGLAPEGATNAEAGLRLGYALAAEAFLPGGINRVILASDGVANVGATSPDGILRSIRGYADEGITLTTLGFGMGNFNDVLMEQLANDGDGNYAYIDDLDEAQRLFLDDLAGALQVIALDAKVQVDFNSEVVARYRLIGYENRAVADQDFRNDAVDAGELGAGHTATALYAVQLRAGAQGRLATVQLRWQDPDTYLVREINGNVNTFDLAPSFESTAPRFQLTAAVSQYAEILRNSPWAYSTTLPGLGLHAGRIATMMPEDGAVAEFAALVSRAGQIRGY